MLSHVKLHLLEVYVDRDQNKLFITGQFFFLKQLSRHTVKTCTSQTTIKVMVSTLFAPLKSQSFIPTLKGHVVYRMT